MDGGCICNGRIFSNGLWSGIFMFLYASDPVLFLAGDLFGIGGGKEEVLGGICGGFTGFDPILSSLVMAL